MWDINNDGKVDSRDDEMMYLAMMQENERQSETDDENHAGGSGGAGCGCLGIVGIMFAFFIIRLICKFILGVDIR